MNRFFATLVNGKPILSDDSRHHLVSVLRIKKGEKIEIVNEQKVYLAVVQKTDPLELAIEKEIEEQRETSIEMILAFSLLKGGHDDLVIQKGTELGIKQFFPFYSERTIVSLKGEKEKQKRKERFEKIALSAVEQSKRVMIPLIHPISPISSIVSLSSVHRYIAYEGEAGSSNSLFKELSTIKNGESVLIVIGPEGGFSENEISLAMKKGFKSISLGRRILRAETACLDVCALLGAYGDEL